MTMTQTTLMTADPRKLTVVPDIKSLVPPLSDAERAALTEDIKEKGAILNPVLIDQNGNVLDGHNRVEIAIELEMDSIPATEVQVADEDDAKRIAIEANLNRRHLTLQARKRIAKELVKLTPWKSNRQIAKAAGVDPKTVGAQRELMEESGEIEPQDTTVGADNKARPAKARKSAEKVTDEKKVNQQFRSDAAALKTGVDELLGKLDRKKMPGLSAEAFVSALTPAQKKASWVIDGLPRVIGFWEEVLHLLNEDTSATGETQAQAVANGEQPAPKSDGNDPF